MSDYAQPEFYHFNQDSIKLAKYVASNEKSVSHLLDLGAGCGVIGIELALKLRPQTLTLVEAQDEFLPFINENISKFVDPAINVKVFNSSFSSWKPSISYDLIVCNPPYFLSGHGLTSSDARRQACRTFVIDDWESLIGLTASSLTGRGKAYFVIRNDQRVLSIVERWSTHLKMNVHEDKGLLFLKLSRLNVD